MSSLELIAGSFGIIVTAVVVWYVLLGHLFEVDDQSDAPAERADEDDRDFEALPFPVLLLHAVPVLGGFGVVLMPIAANWGVLGAASVVAGVLVVCGIALSGAAAILSGAFGGASVGQVAGEIVAPKVRLPFLAVLLVFTLLLTAAGLGSVSELINAGPSVVWVILFDAIAALAVGAMFYDAESPVLGFFTTVFAAFGGLAAATLLNTYLPGLANLDWFLRTLAGWFPALEGSGVTVAAGVVIFGALFSTWVRPGCGMVGRNAIVGARFVALLAAAAVALSSDRVPLTHPNAVFTANSLFLIPTGLSIMTIGVIGGLSSLTSSAVFSRQSASFSALRGIGVVAPGLAGLAGIVLITLAGSVAGSVDASAFDGLVGGSLATAGRLVPGGKTAGAFVVTVILVTALASAVETAIRTASHVLGEFGSAPGLGFLANRSFGTLFVGLSSATLFLAAGFGGRVAWIAVGAANLFVAHAVMTLVAASLTEKPKASRFFMSSGMLVFLLALAGTGVFVYANGREHLTAAALLGVLLLLDLVVFARTRAGLRPAPPRTETEMVDFDDVDLTAPAAIMKRDSRSNVPLKERVQLSEAKRAAESGEDAETEKTPVEGEAVQPFTSAPSKHRSSVIERVKVDRPADPRKFLEDTLLKPKVEPARSSRPSDLDGLVDRVRQQTATGFVNLNEEIGKTAAEGTAKRKPAPADDAYRSVGAAPVVQPEPPPASDTTDLSDDLPRKTVAVPPVESPTPSGSVGVSASDETQAIGGFGRSVPGVGNEAQIETMIESFLEKKLLEVTSKITMTAEQKLSEMLREQPAAQKAAPPVDLKKLVIASPLGDKTVELPFEMEPRLEPILAKLARVGQFDEIQLRKNFGRRAAAMLSSYVEKLMAQDFELIVVEAGSDRGRVFKINTNYVQKITGR